MSILKKDIYEGGNPFDEAIKGTDDFLKKATELDAKLTALAQTLKNDLQKAEMGNAQSIRETTELQKKAAVVIDQKKKSTQNLTEYQKLQQKMNKQHAVEVAKVNSQETQINKTLEKQKLINQERQKDIKAIIKLQRAEKGSIQQLSQVNSILVKKRAQLGDINGKNKQTYERLTRAIAKNETQLKRMDGQIGRSQRHVGDYGRALGGIKKGYAAMAIGVGIAVGVIGRIGSAISGSIKAFGVQEKMVKQANVVFGSYSKEVQKAASETQNMTETGDEQFLKLAGALKNLGVANEDVIETTRGVIGLSEKYAAVGLSQETAAKGVALAMQGNYSQLERYIPALRNANTDAEKAAILQQEMASGFNLAKEAAKTQTGTLQQISNTMGDIREKIGGLILRAFEPLINVVKTAVGWIDGFLDGTKEIPKFLQTIIGVLKVLIPAFIAYNVATTASIALDKLKIFWNNKVIGSFKKLYATMLANPFAAILAAVVAIGTAIYTLATRETEAEKAQKRWNETAKEATKNLTSQSAELSILKKRLGDNEEKTNRLKKSMEGLSESSSEYAVKSKMLKKAEKERSEIIGILNTKHGEYLGNTLKTTDSYLEMAKAIDAANEKLREQIKIKALESITGSIMEDATKAQEQLFEMENLGRDLWAKENRRFGEFLNNAKLRYSIEKNDLQKHIDELLKKHQDYKIKLDEMMSSTETPPPTGNDGGNGGDGGDDEAKKKAAEEAKKKAAEAEEAINNIMTLMGRHVDVVEEMSGRAVGSLGDYSGELGEVADGVVKLNYITEEMLANWLGDNEVTLESLTEQYQNYYNELQMLRALDQLSEEEYSKAIVKAKKEEVQQKSDLTSNYFQNVADISRQGADLVSNLIQLEQAQYQDSENATTEEKEANAAKRKEIAKKYADFQLAANIAEIASNTALGITRAIASPGFPVAAALIPLIAANGILQSAIAVQQRNQVKSLATGGYGDEYGNIHGDRHSAPSGGEDFKEHIKVEAGESWSVWNRRTKAKDGNRLAELTNHVNSTGLDDYLAKHAFVAPVFSSNFSTSDIVREQKRTNEMLSKHKNVWIDKMGNEVHEDLYGNRKIIRK